MRKTIIVLLAPFVAGTLGALLWTHAVPAAQACECSPDGFWVVDDVETEGQALPWPRAGHLYRDRLSLWAEGFMIEVRYTP